MAKDRITRCDSQHYDHVDSVVNSVVALSKYGVQNMDTPPWRIAEMPYLAMKIQRKKHAEDARL